MVYDFLSSIGAQPPESFGQRVKVLHQPPVIHPKQALQVKQQGQGARTKKPKTAGHTETGS